MQIRRSAARSRCGLWLGTHIFVILKNVETSDLSRGLLQICHELGGLGSISDLSGGVESGSEDERDSSEELHGD